MNNFENKTVIITGGSRGIGEGISNAFLREGADLVILYAGNKEKADEFIALNKKYANKISTFKVDVSSYKEVENFYEEFTKKFDRLDILVNNAGVRFDNIVGMMPIEDWERVISVNLSGTFNMSKFAVKLMSRQRWGRIINITSASAEMGFKGQANYSASKAGQHGFTRSLAKEVASRKITVNCISPGFIDTGFISDLPDKVIDEYKKSIPMKRFGTVQEVSAGVLFLASDSASYITGSVLNINGGI